MNYFFLVVFIILLALRFKNIKRDFDNIFSKQTVEYDKKIIELKNKYGIAYVQNRAPALKFTTFIFIFILEVAICLFLYKSGLYIGTKISTLASCVMIAIDIITSFAAYKISCAVIDLKEIPKKNIPLRILDLAGVLFSYYYYIYSISYIITNKF